MTRPLATTGSEPPGWPPELPLVVPPDEPRPGTHPVHPPVPIVYEPSSPAPVMADRLLERRMVVVSGTLDVATATEASARLMFLDGTGDEPIDVMMSCPDGDVVAATALADTIELVGVEVRATCSGRIGGPAVLPFVLATRRLAQPHATVRLSNPRVEAQGRADELATEAEHHAELINELHRRVAAATGQSADRVADDFAHNVVLTARDAKAYGIVDEILRPGGLSAV